MRRLFIMRRDLNLSPGKLAAQVGHCAEAYWTRWLDRNADLDGRVEGYINTEILNDYIKGTFTKTICEAKNKNHLMKAKKIAEQIGLIENQDFGLIFDNCLTELTPEEPDGTTLTGIWFCPLSEEQSHMVSKKYQLYKEHDNSDTVKENEQTDTEKDEECYTLSEWGCLFLVLKDYRINIDHIPGRVGKHIVEDFMELMCKTGYVTKEWKDTNMIKVNYKKLDDGAITPSYGSNCAAGLDLNALITNGAKAHRIPAGTTVKIGTGIAMEIPDGYFGAIFARSGIATKHGLRPANCVGVIDSDYRGEIIVPLHNDSDRCETVRNGDRIAQLVIMPYVNTLLNEVEELNSTDRGVGGFGSTGVATMNEEAVQLTISDIYPECVPS